MRDIGGARRRQAGGRGMLIEEHEPEAPFDGLDHRPPAAAQAPRGLAVGPDRNGLQIAIADGVIVAEPPPGAASLPCPDGEITAGDVCAHTHLYSGLAGYGMPPAAPPPMRFTDLLERVWWKLDRALDAETLFLSARAAIAEALVAGTTALVDHHESPDCIEGSLKLLKRAADDLGIRALLCYAATERNGGRAEATRGLAESVSIAASATVRPLVGLSASLTVSDDTIRDAAALARDRGVGLHVHVAEAVDDVADAQARGFGGPFARLEALDAVVPGTIIAHGVHMSPRAVRRAEAAGCWIVQNPRSNEMSKVGYAAVLAHGHRVALGTDGWRADMAAEEAALFRLAAAHGDAAAAGRRGRGQVLMAEQFGRPATGLAVGALGDLVVRANGQVRDVVVGGRIVVKGGRLVGADIATLRAEAQRAATKLWARMAAL
jgi:cytosine/adenosine deaminase-related metal-dependent hydrolase